MCQSKNSAMLFGILKPLYILYTAVGISSFKFNGEKCIPVCNIHKIICILISTYIVFGISSKLEILITNRYRTDVLKNTMNSLYGIMIQTCVILVWIMSSFVSGKITVKMYLNYCKVERRLKIIQKWTILDPPYLKIIVFHLITLLVIVAYTIITNFVFQYPFYETFIIFLIYVCNLMTQRFCTEIYVIILYIEKMAKEIQRFSKISSAKSMEKVHVLKSSEISKETITLMQLYDKLSENCCISNQIIRFPVIISSLYPFRSLWDK